MGNTATPPSRERNPARRAAETEVWGQISSLWFGNRQVLMDACREFDLYPPQIMLLRTLDEPKPMRAVAEHMACKSSNLTGITDRLEERDLVRRTRDPEDRRVNLLVLTERGERLRTEVMARLDTPLESMSRLTDDELSELTRLIAKISD